MAFSDSTSKKKTTKKKPNKFNSQVQVFAVWLALTQALAHGHAVLLRVEVVAVPGAAAVDEAQAFLLVHVEVPAGHGGATGARLRLQGAHLCEGDRGTLHHPGLVLITKATK